MRVGPNVRPDDGDGVRPDTDGSDEVEEFFDEATSGDYDHQGE
jgi:hypothetical protein